MIDERTSLTDVAGAVAAALRRISYDPVVVGGSAATLHAPDAYRSRDIDMVVVGGIDQRALFIHALSEIGFVLQNGMFVHGKSAFTVDFVPSPVAIGGDVITDFARIESAYGPVRVLHAHDVVNDRLNKSVAYDDPDSFEVAVAVARLAGVNPAQIKAFIRRQELDGAYRERFASAYERLRRRLGLVPRSLSPIGFTTAFRIRFAAPPSTSLAQAVIRAIQTLIDDEREAIDVVLDGVPIVRDPIVHLDAAEPTVARMTLMVSTKREIPLIDRMALAAAIVDHVRSRLGRIPDIVDVPDDGIPPVAFTGPR